MDIKEYLLNISIGQIAEPLEKFLSFGKSVFYNAEYSPNVHITILPRWGDKTKNYIILRIEVENISQIIIPLKGDPLEGDPSKEIGQDLQILVYRNSPKDNDSDSSKLLLSSWVPFSEEAFNETDRLELAEKWHRPFKILRSTKKLYPKEIVSSEVLYHFPEETVLHVGVQIKADIGKLARLVKLYVQDGISYNNFMELFFDKKGECKEQWTTNMIITHEMLNTLPSNETSKSSNPDST
jgi:hypothetical protein